MGRTVSTARSAQAGEAFVALDGLKLSIVPRLLCQETRGQGTIPVLTKRIKVNTKKKKKNRGQIMKDTAECDDLALFGYLML